MHNIYCSTGALIGRPNGRDYRLLKQFVPKLNCDGIELMIYPDWYGDPEALISFLQPLQYNIPVLHCEKAVSEHFSRGGEEEKQEGLRKFHINCEIAQKLNSNKMVFHLWNGIISDDHFENNLNIYGELNQIAKSYDIDLLIENVVCHQDPMSHWIDLQRAYPDIHFVFDTKMADFHRQLDLLYDPEYAWLTDHIRHYHVNDYGGGYMEWTNLKVLPVGKGHIDFNQFFRHLQKVNYRGDYTLEATGFDATGSVNLDLLNDQFDRVRQMIQKTD